MLDTNVVLDFLLAREPFNHDARRIFTKVESGELTGWLCAKTMTTVYYLAQKSSSREKADLAVNLLLKMFQVAPVDRAVLEGAVKAGFDDFEDAVLYESARLSGVEAIITRNEKDFKQAELMVLHPAAFAL